MSGVVLFLIFCVFCPGSVYLSSEIGICSKTNSAIKCCNNYKLNEKGTGCVECDPGFFGDCNTPCPPGRYGQLCETECLCQVQQECHHVTGCVDVITQTSASSGGNCTSRSKNGCCINYRRDNITNTCIVCPDGWYSEDCRDRCPYPFYGHKCGSICDCSKETCDYVTGCYNSNSSKTTIGSQIRKF